MSRSWADDFNTYSEACEYYGVDTPEQAEAEAAYWAAEEAIEHQDRMEARGGPMPAHLSAYLDDEILF